MNPEETIENIMIQILLDGRSYSKSKLLLKLRNTPEYKLEVEIGGWEKDLKKELSIMNRLIETKVLFEYSFSDEGFFIQLTAPF